MCVVRPEVGAPSVLLCESEAVVREPSLAPRIDRVTVDELLLAQRLQVVGGGEPGTVGYGG